MNELVGQFAALTTACCWAFTSIFFTIAAQRVGSAVANRVRLVFAMILLAITHLIMFGSIFPFHAELDRWFWLGLSGVIGLVIGDAMLFEAYVLIGTRLPLLLLSLAPVISTVLAWIFLGEKLSAVELLAIAVTVGGITWVVADKNRERHTIGGKKLALGLLLGFGGAFGQAAGLIASKLGLYGDFPALSGNLIKMTVAVAVMWLLTAITGKVPYTISKLRDIKATRALLTGAITGPFIGVWMSLVAIKLARVGIASTIMAFSPILTIPLVRIYFKEQVSIHAILGTVTAIIGISLLFLV